MGHGWTSRKTECEQRKCFKGPDERVLTQLDDLWDNNDFLKQGQGTLEYHCRAEETLLIIIWRIFDLDAFTAFLDL